MSNREEDVIPEFTVESFAQWMLTLPDEIKKKKIWYIDITRPYKGKGLWVDENFSKTHVTIEDAIDDSRGEKET